MQKPISRRTMLRGTDRRLRAKPGTRFCNLHLALLQRLGVKLDSGDSTGPRARLRPFI